MLWGGLHGLMLVINHLWGSTRLCARLGALTGTGAAAWRLFRIVLTFQAICFAWSFFRLTNLTDSLASLRKWIVFDADKAFAGGSDDLSLWLLLAAYGLATLAAVLLTRGAPLPEAIQHLIKAPVTTGVVWGGAAGIFVLALLLAPGGDVPPFIYFQF
jgi:hypothetical protein